MSTILLESGARDLYSQVFCTKTKMPKNCIESKLKETQYPPTPDELVPNNLYNPFKDYCSVLLGLYSVALFSHTCVCPLTPSLYSCCVMLFYVILTTSIFANLQFFFQHGRPPPNDLKEQCLFRTSQLFHDHLDGLQVHGEISHI